MNASKKSVQLTDKSYLNAKAVYLGERIDTRALETTTLLATSPLTFEVSKTSYAVVFKYGVVVLFDVTSLDEVSFLAKLDNYVFKKIEPPETDKADIQISNEANEGMLGNMIYIKTADVERLQLVAEILSKNVVLSYYETRIGENFDQIEPIAEKLYDRSRLTNKARFLTKHIGSTLLIMHKMVGRVEVSEKPELLWEYQELERFYSRLEDEYEIKERHLAVERKIELISRTAGTVLDLLQAKRTLRVEWYIVILIVIEIIFTIYELFLRH